MAPPGYRTTYTTAFTRVAATVDTRRDRPDDGSGGYLSLQALPSFDLHSGGSWIAYGGVVGGAHRSHRASSHPAAAGRARLRRLHVGRADPVHRISSARRRGDARLRRRLDDRSQRRCGAARLHVAGVARARRADPVHHRQCVRRAPGGFALDKLRMSADFGFTTSTAYDQGLEMLFGLGSETFEQGRADHVGARDDRDAPRVLISAARARRTPAAARRMTPASRPARSGRRAASERRTG